MRVEILMQFSGALTLSLALSLLFDRFATRFLAWTFAESLTQGADRSAYEGKTAAVAWRAQWIIFLLPFFTLPPLLPWPDMVWSANVALLIVIGVLFMDVCRFFGPIDC